MLKILAIVRNLKYCISRNAHNKIYMSDLLLVFEYASVVWDGDSELNTSKDTKGGWGNSITKIAAS